QRQLEEEPRFDFLNPISRCVCNLVSLNFNTEVVRSYLHFSYTFYQTPDDQLVCTRHTTLKLHFLFTFAEKQRLLFRRYSGMTLDKLGGSTRGPIVQSFCIKTIAELVSKQHWSELKTRLISTKPAELLDQLLDAGVDSKLVLRFFQWSQRELKLSYGLETTGKVLHSLVKSKCYSKKFGSPRCL
ncbi:hypothetical protein S245_042868, partial [Arachis hypogaea]